MKPTALRHIIAAAAAALLAGVSTGAVAAPRPWPNTTSGIHVFNDQLPGDMNPALTGFSATHYAGCQKMTRIAADSLRAYNPNFLILHYRLGIGLGYREPDAYGDPTGPYLMIIEGDWVREWPASAQNQWFYTYASSPRVYNNMWGWCLIEPDNAAWQSYWLGEINRQFVANDNDGLFADSVSVPNYLGPDTFTPNLPVIDPVFETEWSAKIGRWQNWAKAGIGANYKLIPNAGFWITTRDITDYSGADGVMVEGFAAWGQTDPFELTDWQLQMDRVLNLISQDKIVIAQSYIDRPDDTAWRTYMLANYLLVKGTKTFINMDTGYDPEWFPEYGANLGSFVGEVPSAVSELYRPDWQVYAREYSGGLALVNPSGTARSFDVGPGYQLVTPHGGGIVPEDGDISAWYLSYAPISAITLQPYSGAVLVKSGGLSVTPETGLTSSGTQGGPFSPSSVQYTLANDSAEPLNWTATHLPAATWVTVSPTSGSLAAGQTTVTVSINSGANALTPGTYSDTVSFTNTTTGQGNTSRLVSLEVAAIQPSGMTVTPLDDFISAGPTGGPFVPASLTYTVSNTGVAPLDFTTEHGNVGNWLSLCHNLPGGASTSVTAALTELANALGPGVYDDLITFTNVTSHQGDTTRDLNLTVLLAGLSVTPSTGFSSSGDSGGPFSPSSKAYTLTNTSASPLDWTASHDPLVDWIILSATSGTLAASASTTVVVSIGSAATTLGHGAHNDTVAFTNATSGVGNTTRPVTLTVRQGVLSVTPADGLVSSGAVGGPFSPSSKQYTLSNTGNAELNWAASHNPSVNWVTLSGTYGTLMPGASATVTVTINSDAQSLGQGTHSDSVSFTSDGGSATRPVSLTAQAKVLSSVAVSPTSLVCPSNDSRQLHATANFSDSTSLDVTSLGTWTSSRTSVCTVSASGVITPRSAGTANITCTYTYGGMTRSASCAINVSYQTIYYLYLTPASAVIYGSAPRQFVCQARTRTGWIDVTQICQWTSSTPGVATVDWRGMATPITNGSASIAARYAYNGVDKAATALVAVDLR